MIPSDLSSLDQIFMEPQEGVSKKRSDLQEIFPMTSNRSSFKLVRKSVPSSPLLVGVVFSGGQASGGHNVIAGLWDAVRAIDSSSQLFGFLDGPSGIVEGKYRQLKDSDIDSVRNMGGFDLLGSGRTKIETEDQILSAAKVCKELLLDGLVVIGGDDSNTNAAILAERFLKMGLKTQVIGVPKTIDGDLQSEDIEISFGFDSACKTYSEMIGNIARDAISAKKYYHFIKLMGRSASHITLECALATHPNLAFIGEEKKDLQTTIQEIADLICLRKEAGKEYGVILIPEGLIEFIPEMRELILELNQIAAKNLSEDAKENLSEKNRILFETLPEKIQSQLLLDRDPHGNVALSQIETESLLIESVKKELKKRSGYQGKFTPVPHFFGYEGRACFPSNFDANYCYALGRLAALGIRDKASGCICAIEHLTKKAEDWKCKLVPIVHLIHMEERKGVQKPVIRKALVDLKGKAFSQFSKMRNSWKLEDDYQFPGPIQFWGDSDLVDSVPNILRD